MALSPAEKSRAFRERLERELRIKPDLTYAYLTEPFHEWLEDTGGANADWDSAMMELDAAGLDVIEIVDDLGPRSKSGMIELTRRDEDGYDPYAGYLGSIGQLESVIDCLVTAAQAFALIANRYKLSQLKLKIAEIESRDLSEPENRKAALAELVQINKIQELLQKQIRITFQPWKVKAV